LFGVGVRESHEVDEAEGVVFLPGSVEGVGLGGGNSGDEALDDA